MKGLDISVYQKNINFNDIKKHGFEFLIIRGGFTGWGTGVDHHKDNYFESFYNQAKFHNIPVGVYWFSCANTYEKGKAEAEYLHNNCLFGKQFEYPIYIDVEDSHHQIGNPAGVTAAIKGFCESLESRGYYVGIYASLSWFKNNIYLDKLTAYDKWLAQWTTIPSADFPFGMWQNSSTYNLNGVTVDTNVCYKNYPEIMKNAGLNGFSKNQSSNKTLPQFTDEELALKTVRGEFGNGYERKNILKERYESVMSIVNEKYY